MLAVVISCVLLIALTTLIHYQVLRGLHIGLPKLRIVSHTKLLVVIFAAFTAHAVEIGLYGITLYGLIQYMGAGSLSLGETSLLDCFYFSAETYSSLGLGDITPSGPVRLLAGVEALNGLLLIAWSASYLYLTMQRLWDPGPLDEGDREGDR